MRKPVSWILSAAAVGAIASFASKRLRPPLAPEGSWKDVSVKPSTNGSQPG
ncbi:MAG TPA: hypothetical protein VHJ78_05830 [Actinomycetota bacterium]|nr:hypothetical protein [Actinomycetota bacterium]